VLEAGAPILELMTDHTGFMPSKAEAKRALKEGSISVNKLRVDDTRSVGMADVYSGTFVLLQRGKKNYFLVKVV
jgi:tyrosyl-tRNA synthetase